MTCNCNPLSISMHTHGRGRSFALTCFKEEHVCRPSCSWKLPTKPCKSPGTHFFLQEQPQTPTEENREKYQPIPRKSRAIGLDVLAFQAGRETLRQLFCLLCVGHNERVQVPAAPDLELGLRIPLADLDELGVGSPRLLQEVANVANLLRHRV
jgi:hypothetical protein